MPGGVAIAVMVVPGWVLFSMGSAKLPHPAQFAENHNNYLFVASFSSIIITLPLGSFLD